MNTFQVVPPKALLRNEADTHKDQRTMVERMFFNHDPQTGNSVPLPITLLRDDEDYKEYTDCIPLIKNFRGTDPTYAGSLKGRSVLVFGGRRQGRAGTGVELLMPVDDVTAFCALAVQVAESAQ